MSKNSFLFPYAFRMPIASGTYLSIASCSIVLLIVLWAIVSRLEFFPTKYFPDPISVAQTAIIMFSSEGFLVDILASAGRIAVAFSVAAAIAIPLGLLMSSFKAVEAFVEPTVDFARYVPVPALLPIFVLLGGIGEAPKFLVLFMGTFFQLVLLIMDDADRVPRLDLEIARTMGASTVEVFRDVLVPHLLPQIYDRLRVTLGWCWTYLVIAELINVQTGVGHVIKEGSRHQDAERVFVCCIALGLIGLLTDYVAKFFYRRMFPYATKATLKSS